MSMNPLFVLGAVVYGIIALVVARWVAGREAHTDDLGNVVSDPTTLSEIEAMATGMLAGLCWPLVALLWGVILLVWVCYLAMAVLLGHALDLFFRIPIRSSIEKRARVERGQKRDLRTLPWKNR